MRATQKWADSATHLFYLLGAFDRMAWHGMALVDVLEKMPANHPNRPNLITLVKQLVHAYARYHDPKTVWEFADLLLLALRTSHFGSERQSPAWQGEGETIALRGLPGPL